MIVHEMSWSSQDLPSAPLIKSNYSGERHVLNQMHELQKFRSHWQGKYGACLLIGVRQRSAGMHLLGCYIPVFDTVKSQHGDLRDVCGLFLVDDYGCPFRALLRNLPQYVSIIVSLKNPEYLPPSLRWLS